MKKQIFAILIIFLAVNKAQAATKISIQPFCDASDSLMSVFTVIEGTTVRKSENPQNDRFVFKATCILSNCSIALIDLKNLEAGQPLDLLDIVVTDATLKLLDKGVYQINSGFTVVYTIDLNNKTVTYQMSLPDFGSAKAQTSVGVGRCD